jgi:hypothetical protein
MSERENGGTVSEQRGGQSGLANPEAAVRGVGAGTLVLEALVLLLAILPLRTLGGTVSGVAIGLVVALAAGAVLVAGLLGRGAWAWWAGSGVQVVLFAGGLVHWVIGVVGLLFGVAWLFVLYVRRRVLATPN